MYSKSRDLGRNTQPGGCALVTKNHPPALVHEYYARVLQATWTRVEDSQSEIVSDTAENSHHHHHRRNLSNNSNNASTCASKMLSTTACAPHQKLHLRSTDGPENFRPQSCGSAWSYGEDVPGKAGWLGIWPPPAASSKSAEEGVAPLECAFALEALGTPNKDTGRVPAHLRRQSCLFALAPRRARRSGRHKAPSSRQARVCRRFLRDCECPLRPLKQRQARPRQGPHQLVVTLKPGKGHVKISKIAHCRPKRNPPHILGIPWRYLRRGAAESISPRYS